MTCVINNNSDGSVRAVLEFRRSELLYDISNAAYIEGRSLAAAGLRENASGEERSPLVHLIQDIAEEGNVDHLNRVLALQHAKITELLNAYTRRDVSRQIITDAAEAPAVYAVMMNIPAEFSQTTLDYLSRLIHDWLVAAVLHDWLSIHWPDKAPHWERRLSDLDEEIRGCANARQAYRRRPLHPFG